MATLREPGTLQRLWEGKTSRRVTPTRRCKPREIIRRNTNQLPSESLEPARAACHLEGLRGGLQSGGTEEEGAGGGQAALLRAYGAHTVQRGWKAQNLHVTKGPRWPPKDPAAQSNRHRGHLCGTSQQARPEPWARVVQGPCWPRAERDAALGAAAPAIGHRSALARASACQGSQKARPAQF